MGGARPGSPIEPILRVMVISTIPALLLAGFLGAGAASTAATKQAMTRVEYEAPKKPEHVAVAEKMRRERLLEDSADMLTMLKLPKLLTLRAETCGESNAWYDSETHVLTF